MDEMESYGPFSNNQVLLTTERSTYIMKATISISIFYHRMFAESGIPENDDRFWATTGTMEGH